MVFNPKYTITPKLLKNIKQVAVLIEGLNARSFSEIVFAKLAKASREISTYASTSIEGNPIPLTEVKKILKSTPKNIRDSEREVLNYNNAMEKANDYIISQKAPTRNVDFNKLIDLNLIIKQGKGKATFYSLKE